ncbi:tRNA (guanosine(37)-N1)-methyltransferase TrmD [Trueperella bialowiezensis]|uniref:tRNA (guanine-N(1)-)-methyltransferase n=1 Tax=Trueperella bialowiezensis TaxID=312285 RepID=A0A448PCL5_9ACTO|nr:tRNA (guanosine(37)-N1)-methyltransferase TrmD [Trueperella bialowiezensis]VEI12693.1 tRNA (guanine-N(1)-)-methyltransferase [Trueperella bialowiezensis]
MRFDIISVFPEFFSVLDLSLVGKARERGLIAVQAHDLRDWTSDVHRTVDDAPFGGGAGMVMKPDVWAKAIDDVARAADGETPGSDQQQSKVVLAIPTPAGEPLTQADCWQLADTDHLIIACGRYEGIDARVADYYRGQGVEVFEYSLGDFVLNGGEVAAIALVEAVARLVPGMVGNPDSLREESHGEQGLLEYPIYTRPTDFRGLQVPEVLTSGDHGKVARWRRDQALERTAQRRPDMIAALHAEQLDKKDRAKLAELGWLVQGDELVNVVVEEASPEEATAVAELAGRLFPHACPPEMKTEDIQAFIDQNLTEKHFAHYIADPNHIVLVARDGRDIGGYSLSIIPRPGEVEPDAPVDVVLDVPRNGPLAYLSKMYIEPAWRGTGLFDLLMGETIAAIRRASDGPEPYVWLGTNAGNKRAIRAYKRAGFAVVGEREFLVGDQINKDVTLAIRANMPK